MVRNDRIWSWLDATLLQTARFLEWERKKSLPDPLDAERTEFMRLHLADRIVRHGPFEGMHFPVTAAPTGRLLPKLLGCYESELHSVIEACCRANYDHVINIGCGEGYYAVGFARRLHEANVYAYDLDSVALAQCVEMAAVNDVTKRVHCQPECRPETLQNFAYRGRALVISDCEGFEKELFTADVVKALCHHDVLIEVHDFVDLSISTILRQRFAATHSLTCIASISDIKRAIDVDLPELSGLSADKRRRLIGEDRNQAMEWFWFQSLWAASNHKAF